MARRLDTGEEDLQVEGSIAKYFATEAGDAMANDAIQAFGGYGYMREYEVEKIKRDVKILPIYEGTSEIQRNIISMFRLRETVRSKGRFYQERAERLADTEPESGGPLLSRAMDVMNHVILTARRHKLTKSQYVMFLIADMITWAEVADALCRKAARYQGGQPRTPVFMKAAARLFVREALEKIHMNGTKIAYGCGRPIEAPSDIMQGIDVGRGMAGYLEDMDLISAELIA